MESEVREEAKINGDPHKTGEMMSLYEEEDDEEEDATVIKQVEI